MAWRGLAWLAGLDLAWLGWAGLGWAGLILEGRPPSASLGVRTPRPPPQAPPPRAHPPPPPQPKRPPPSGPVILATVDKWVQEATGDAPHKARLTELRSQLAKELASLKPAPAP